MTLGATMNAAFLASVYGQYIQGGTKENQQKGKRYVCWARGQVGPPAGLVRLLGMPAWLHEDAPARCPEKPLSGWEAGLSSDQDQLTGCWSPGQTVPASPAPPAF